MARKIYISKEKILQAKHLPLIHHQNLKQGTRQGQSRFSSQLDGKTKIKKR